MKNDGCSEESPQFRTQGFRRFPVAIFGYLTIGADPDRIQHIPFCHFEMECQSITDCITDCTKGRAVAFHLMPAICCCSTEGAAPHNTQRLSVVLVGIGCTWWFGVVALGTPKCPQNGVALGHFTTKSQAAIAAAKKKKKKVLSSTMNPNVWFLSTNLDKLSPHMWSKHAIYIDTTKQARIYQCGLYSR